MNYFGAFALITWIY